ncbi:hypothetical protein LUZ60_004749 [Juncus effusus]|nr:hypothetical protein LUZ60_004749 [Juncus effusus]
MASPPPAIRTVNTYPIKHVSNPLAPCQIHLTPWELALLNAQYIQKGLLFIKPLSSSFTDVFASLKDSLEEALYHFSPYSARLKIEGDGEVTWMELEMVAGSDGAEIIHAAAEHITVADVAELGIKDSPEVIRKLFPLDGAICFDGCSKPLLVVQVTELADGVFIGCSLNLIVADGTSIWHFLNAWAEIARAKKADIKNYMLSRPPVLDRWFIEGYEDPPIKLPFSSIAQFIERFEPPSFRERLFHFSPESIADLKAKANQECEEAAGSISSFQALASLVWRAITRARHLSQDVETTCQLAIQNRSRLNPALSPDYFGNSIYVIPAISTVKDLLSHNLGWAAWLINRTIFDHNDSTIRAKIHSWMSNPTFFKLSTTYNNPNGIHIGSSPRFEMYECDFGLGKPVAICSGNANKYDGKLSLYPGWEGGGSMDLEVCLNAEAMDELLKDEEFMNVVSPPVDLRTRLEIKFW